MTSDHPEWLRTYARLLIEYRDNAQAVTNRLNAHARIMGQPFDRRADNAGGAAGAYGIAIAALVGAVGASSIESIAAEPLHRDMLRPVLPDELTEPCPVPGCPERYGHSPRHTLEWRTAGEGSDDADPR